MTRRESQRLADIRDAIGDIREALAGVNRQAFLNDKIRRNAVSMYILVISEAVRNLPPELTDRYPEIPWRKIADIGNVIRHTYFRVEYEALWDICEYELDALDSAISSMISRIEN